MTGTSGFGTAERAGYFAYCKPQGAVKLAAGPDSSCARWLILFIARCEEKPEQAFSFAGNPRGDARACSAIRSLEA